MDHRPLGRTGVSVSQLTLGAKMFGAWGNPDHDESVRIIRRARRPPAHIPPQRSARS